MGQHDAQVLAVDLRVSQVLAVPGDIDLIEEFVQKAEIRGRPSFVGADRQADSMHDDLGALAHVLEFSQDLAAQRNLFAADFGDRLQGDLASRRWEAAP